MRFHELFALALAVASVTSVRAAQEASSSSARLKAEEEKLRLLSSRLEDLQGELASLDRRETTLLGELHRLELEIRVSGEELELLKLQLDRRLREMDENLERIQALEKSIDELKPFLASRARGLYQLGRLSYVRLLLSVEEPSELTRAYRYISRLAREDAAKMDRFLRDQKALEEAKAELQVQTDAMLQMRKDLESTARTLENRRASRQSLLEDVYARQEMAGSLVQELEEAKEGLGRLVASLASGEAPEGETVLLPMRMFEGELPWPVEGTLEARFGTQLHPRFRTVTVRNGIEIDAPLGTEVSSVYDGEVVYASWFQGYGKLLIVQHPGEVHSLYGYLSEFNAEVGDRVERGEPIGWVGDTGSLSGPGLYFEIRVQGRPEDPEQWLDPRKRGSGAHASN